VNYSWQLVAIIAVVVTALFVGVWLINRRAESRRRRDSTPDEDLML
jgi:nitrate reductase gamma subunit